MEWSGQQQIQRLLQCVVLGAMQGFMLDVITGFARAGKKRKWLWTDVLFGPFAAVFTFLGALVIMDGHLHPILLIGVCVGMLLEHMTIGAVVCRALRCVCYCGTQIVRFGHRILRRFVTAVALGFGRLVHRRPKMPQNSEKQRKLYPFFQKKT